jgi:hypothetical protein
VAKGRTMQSWSTVFRGDAAMLCNGCVVEGWAVVCRTMHLQTTAFRGVAAMRCNGRCFWEVGGSAMDNAHAGRGVLEGHCGALSGVVGG